VLYVQKLIRTRQKIYRFPRVCFFQLRERVESVAHAFFFCFYVGNPYIFAFVFFKAQFAHFKPVLGRRLHFVFFVGRYVRRHDQKFVEAESFVKFERGDFVASVDRVERPAENTDFFCFNAPRPLCDT
jgi:hypothetical protein